MGGTSRSIGASPEVPCQTRFSSHFGLVQRPRIPRNAPPVTNRVPVDKPETFRHPSHEARKVAMFSHWNAGPRRACAALSRAMRPNLPIRCRSSPIHGCHPTACRAWFLTPKVRGGCGTPTQRISPSPLHSKDRSPSTSLLNQGHLRGAFDHRITNLVPPAQRQELQPVVANLG